MNAVGLITGPMAPLPRANVDTDQIMPKEYLKRIERTGFGPFLFHDWAYDSEGEVVAEFVLNRPEFADAVVLVTGPNFGSGSSREHAPWGLEDRGFRAIIAPSFADIFFNNCLNIGLLPVVLTTDEVTTLTAIAQGDSNTVTIDLEAQSVTAPGFVASFDIDAFARHRLLNGLDSIALTLAHADAIDTFESRRPGFNPTLR